MLAKNGEASAPIPIPNAAIPSATPNDFRPESGFDGLLKVFRSNSNAAITSAVSPPRAIEVAKMPRPTPACFFINLKPSFTISNWLIIFEFREEIGPIPSLPNFLL